MNNKEPVLAEGFFNPKQLLDNASQFKRLSVLEPPKMFDILSNVRKEEIKELKKYDGIYNSEKNSILNGINLSILKDKISDEEIDDLMHYLLEDSSIWLYFLFLQMQNETFWSERVEFKNKEVLDDALKENKGVILGQLHCGPFQLLAPILAKLDYDILQMFGEKDAEEWGNDLLHEYIGNNIKYASVTVPESGFLIKSLKALKRNRIVALPLEVTGSDAVPEQTVNFLGREVYAPDGACSLAALTGSPIILVKLSTYKDKLEVSFENPVYVNSKKEIESVNETVFKSMEAMILKSPLEWRGWGFFEEMAVSPNENGVNNKE